MRVLISRMPGRKAERKESNSLSPFSSQLLRSEETEKNLATPLDALSIRPRGTKSPGGGEKKISNQVKSSF